jgi:hypothetical protein
VCEREREKERERENASVQEGRKEEGEERIKTREGKFFFPIYI